MKIKTSILKYYGLSMHSHVGIICLFFKRSQSGDRFGSRPEVLVLRFLEWKILSVGIATMNGNVSIVHVSSPRVLYTHNVDT